MNAKRLASLAITAIALLLLSSCGTDMRPIASGYTGTVTVVMDSTDWNGTVGEATRELFETYIETLPHVEPLFTVDYKNITSIEQFERVIRPRKYLFFAGTLQDTNNVALFIQARMDSTTQLAIELGEPGLFQLEDVWLRDQLVYYATAPTDSLLASTIRDNADLVRYNFNQANRIQMEREMFSQYRQTELEDSMRIKHDFFVKVQHDYLVAADTTSLFWMRRFVNESNWRNAFVYYIEDADPSDISLPWVVEARNRITETWLTGTWDDFVKIDGRQPLESKEINFLGRYARETRGLWHMVGYDQEGELRSAGGGGPFVNYTFFDDEQGRIYMIDGMVFAPKYDKRELLRQLEVIAHTFQTRQDFERFEAAAKVADASHN